MSKLYVVVSQKYEYNDETYDAQGIANLITYYDNVGEAVEATYRLTNKDISSGGYYMYEYMYDDDLVDYDNLSATTKEYLQENTSYAEATGDYCYTEFFVNDWAKMPTEIRYDFIKNLVNPLYFVQQVSANLA